MCQSVDIWPRLFCARRLRYDYRDAHGNFFCKTLNGCSASTKTRRSACKRDVRRWKNENFKPPFTPCGWLRSASNLAKKCFRRFPTFHFSTPETIFVSKSVFAQNTFFPGDVGAKNHTKLKCSIQNVRKAKKASKNETSGIVWNMFRQSFVPIRAKFDM